MARVVIVAEEQRDHARRGGGQERLRGAARRGQRGLQIVRCRRCGRFGSRTPIGPRCSAGVLRRDAAGIAEHPLGQIGEVDEVLIDEAYCWCRRTRRAGP